MRLEQLGERDRWTCWVCRAPVDRAGPPSAPAAPSIDHVLPRAKGGSSDPANLRLAHRRCNGSRGSRLPELDWPRHLPAVEAAPLWPAAQRALRRPGDWEAVAFLPTAAAAATARAWLAGTLPDLLGGSWEVVASPAGPTSDLLHVVRLRALGSDGGQRPGRRGKRGREPRRASG